MNLSLLHTVHRVLVFFIRESQFSSETKPTLSHTNTATTNKRAHLSECSGDAAVASIAGRFSLKTSTPKSQPAESWKSARLKVSSKDLCLLEC